MPCTKDFEHLLERKNVIGVEYDEETNTVTVYVSEKLPDSELADEDNVKKLVTDADVKVEDSGFDEERDGFDALSLTVEIPEAETDRKDRHRPVVGGVSEINAKSTAATAGPYPARITDTSSGKWSDDATEGDLVRLSNNHVYARVNKAEFGEPIIQPSPRDGGEHPDDETGTLQGYVPVEDGSTVDVAARSVSVERESPEYHELDDSWPTAVRREDYRSLKGETVRKTGRTTGVTSADVSAVGASVRVNFGDAGTLTLRDQLIAGQMSKGGDSGSPVFHDGSGELVGLLFAGSKRQTILNKIGNVESQLGVELLTEEPGDGDDDGGEGGDGDGTRTYRETLDTTVTVSMDGPELSLESFSMQGDISPGEEAEATATVTGTDTGTGWLNVQGEQYTFELTDEHAKSGRYVRSVPVLVVVPESSGDSFEVHVEGGYVVRA
ncbi:chymotrypsin family serine protease [Halogranum rubrum]|uniref:Peptidase S1 domain-containing protein n=1 Tax=Halogranum salarium B-1 TaxID=1210908 RepID=J3ETR3_9EURY|nr:hypothetical protein [Halogranum salarium]EJN57592.1 hypothetical protein HSB1_39530 [Halogranum salarium B-1]